MGNVTGRWWGRFELEPGSLGRWAVGPLRLWVRHDAGEWWICRQEGPDPLSTDLAVECPAEAELPTPGEVQRFPLTKDTDDLLIEPALADRSIVARPDPPVGLVGGEAVTLFVGSPLWLRIKAGPAAKRLRELPAWRPSDTWFGPDTSVGELCYASRTAARLQLGGRPVRPHRALTRVTIHNQGTETIELERVSLPVRELSLFLGEDERFWTDTVAVEIHPDGTEARVRVTGTPPEEAGAAERLAGPRDEPRTGLMRALGELLG